MNAAIFFAHETAALDQIPVLPYPDFAAAAVATLTSGMELLAFFGDEDAGSQGTLPRLFALFGQPATGRISALSCRPGPELASLTPSCPQFHLFEREIAECFGLRFPGHPWFKPLRFECPRPGATDAWGRDPGRHPLPADMEFFRVEGDEVHEVGVGPVHAGIIEPGHFRFQCFGEKVLHLEISLGYQHRGLEKALAAGGRPGVMAMVETIAGDSTVGHSMAYCQMLETLARCRPPARALALRRVALELERLANHVGDIGALAGDVGFLPVAAYCGRLRGEYLNMSAAICGSRFGRGLVRPGGVLFGLDAAGITDLLQHLERVVPDTNSAIDLFFHSPSVLARLERVGVLQKADADALGTVGVAGRASGRDCDSRRSYPAPDAGRTDAITCDSGDVFARAKVRSLEITAAVATIRETLGTFAGEDGASLTAMGDLRPKALAVGIVEGWRGRIVHVGISDVGGRLKRVKVVDPSFFNWSGLAMAMRDEEISDFPLANKSFNLSYCGFDL